MAAQRRIRGINQPLPGGTIIGRSKGAGQPGIISTSDLARQLVATGQVAAPGAAGGGLSVPVKVSQGGTGLTTVPANGQLLIGNGSDYAVGTVTAGSGITITNGAGSIVGHPLAVQSITEPRSNTILSNP